MKSKWKLVFLVLFLFLPFLVSQSSYAIDNEECLECHGDTELVKTLPNGKTISLYVDEKKFAASVHGQNELSCTDCHSDITTLNYENEVPHPSPTKPVDCSSCHEEEREAYKNSVHYEVREAGEEAPTCKDCHNYHYTKYLEASTAEERNRESCLKCHQPKDSHKFLPAKGLHFEKLSCSGCHSQDTSKMVRLLPYSVFRGKIVSGEEIVKALGCDFEDIMKEFDKNKNGMLDTQEITSLIKEIKKTGLRISLTGEIVPEMSPEVHSISSEGTNNCKKCHSAKANILNNTYFTLTKKDGSVENYKASKGILYSIYPIRFYLLDSTRVKLLDIIGILIVLGGIGFAGGHLTVRILTIPLRRREKK